MCTSFTGCSVNKIHISFPTPNYFGSLWYSSFNNFRLRILMSRLFISEYKNNIKFKENKKKSKQQTTA